MGYNIRISNELSVPQNENELCENPYNQTSILLLPKQILSPLPITECFDDIDFACSENERIRNEINQYFDLGERKKLSKEEIDHLLKVKIDYRDEMIATYKKIVAKEYDFDNDPAGEIIWYQISKDRVSAYPLELTQPYSIVEMESVVERICHKFKKLIEDNGLWRLLYDKNKPKHETAAQLLFYGIADAYCSANSIDLSREVHNGHRERLDSFQDYYNTLKTEDRKKVKYILIDGNIQKSASKA